MASSRPDKCSSGRSPHRSRSARRRGPQGAGPPPPCRDAARRRSSTSAEDRSSQCASSTTSSRGVVAALSVRTPRVASADQEDVGASPSTTPKAMSRALRCGSGKLRQAVEERQQQLMQRAKGQAAPPTAFPSSSPPSHLARAHAPLPPQQRRLADARLATHHEGAAVRPDPIDHPVELLQLLLAPHQRKPGRPGPTDQPDPAAPTSASASASRFAPGPVTLDRDSATTQSPNKASNT